MAGKFSALELVGTSIFIGSHEVAVLTGPAGACNGTLREHVEALLENAREGVIDEDEHDRQIRDLENAHSDEIADLEHEQTKLEEEVEELEARIKELEAVLNDVEVDGAKGVLFQIDARLQNEKKTSDGLMKAVRQRDAQIARLDAKIAKLKEGKVK